MDDRRRDEPLGTGHFRVVVGERELGFAEVGPLSAGGMPATIVLRRALTRSPELFEWSRRDDRREVRIEQLDGPGGEIANAWTLVGAHPLRWTGPRFDAIAGGIAFEELELAYEDIRWTKGA